MNTKPNPTEALTQSEIYREFERAFTEVTGLPVAFRPRECWQLPLHGKKGENPFCALMAERSRTCSACLQTQESLCQSSGPEARTMTCSYGLTETAVPVRLGNETLGYLQTGQVFKQKPTEKQFERAAALLLENGLETGRDEVRQKYFETPVFAQKKLESVSHLLSVFAEHLSLVSNQLTVQRQNSEPPVITKARDYIQEHHTEDLSLGQVAKAVNTSTFYFCKLFKKATGLNFTDYVARVRIERAKHLLLNPNLRISEIAYEVGFQSLTHFNRVFKRIMGESPTEYRGHLPVCRNGHAN